MKLRSFAVTVGESSDRFLTSLAQSIPAGVVLLGLAISLFGFAGMV